MLVVLQYFVGIICLTHFEADNINKIDWFLYTGGIQIWHVFREARIWLKYFAEVKIEFV